nr:ABC transporter permease [Janthinobacterium sp. UMAB-56]
MGQPGAASGRQLEQSVALQRDASLQRQRPALQPDHAARHQHRHAQRRRAAAGDGAERHPRHDHVARQERLRRNKRARPATGCAFRQQCRRAQQCIERHHRPQPRRQRPAAARRRVRRPRHLAVAEHPVQPHGGGAKAAPLMSMLLPALTIARYTLLEALRSRLPWLFVLAACAAAGLAGFLQQLALTESGAVQAALLAATLRLAGVFLLATFIITGMAREAADRGLELLLALPMPRAAYLLGKLLGYGALAAVPALLFGLLMALFAAPAQCALWTLSLLGELWIVAAFSLLCAASLQQALPALAATGGFYVLARMLGSLQLLAHGPQAGDSLVQRAAAGAIDVLALLLPSLDAFARTDWLLYATGDWQALGRVAMQTIVYVGLLSSCALCDFYRRNI